MYTLHSSRTSYTHYYSGLNTDSMFFIFHLLKGYIPPRERPDRFQVYAEIVDDENKLSYCTNDIPRTHDSDVMALIQLNISTPTCKPDSSSLKAYRKYMAWIVSKNDFGESNSTGEIPFSKSVGIKEHFVHIFPLFI